MVVILISGDESDVMLDSRALEGVARLGITSLALLRDDDMVALVAEGWAFDAANSLQAVEALVATTDRPARTLHSVGHMVLEGPGRQSRPGRTQRL
ncbi:MAG TPA: hypothetical protein VFD47_12035 [Actinomycetota bacterium]|nr:hypothetical protein [Actinomycetota bacterium]